MGTDFVRRVSNMLAVPSFLVWLTFLLSLTVLPSVALADADEGAAMAPGAPPPGMQPLAAPIPKATTYPGESRLRRREDGTFDAIPVSAGKLKTFTIVARSAPWTLKPGLTVMAKTYNGVVPGPTLSVNQGDRVVIDFRNELDIADTIHLHGIHGTAVDMDGVPGSSQAMVPPHGTFRYAFTASQAGTFIYHTHDRKAVLDAGLYGGIIVKPAHPRPEEVVARDYLEIISAWYVNSASESEFTLNGKEYPATRPLEVRAGEKIRVRWINISAENFHTMHTHGHYMTVIARDAMPLETKDVEDTVELGPGQRVDTTIVANARPGTWMVHCHVLDHTEDGGGMPDGLITSLHYAGTPDKTVAMYDAMMGTMKGGDTVADGAPAPAPGKLSFAQTTMLGAFAGLTIFLGLPIARAKKLRPGTIGLLNAFAIGILVFLVIEISMNAIIPVNRALIAWHTGAIFPVALVCALGFGLVLGLVGLGAASTALVKRSAKTVTERPIVLAAIVAVGIGAHNFAEGLAIGASAAAGATAIAAGLIIGFALHNATEGFGVAAPLAGKVVPTWAQIGIAGLVAGGPTFLGTMLGYTFSSPTLSVFFLATAIGALVFVVGELWSVLKKTGVTIAATSMVTAGFAVAFVTEAIISLNGG
ncbi:MAG: multicopper oxidase domain-containing protein [Candidatus Eremiobacteraeota bacterium]|nr:multicopper oxidase domain-containing protein [Candidatus Eremiobacteraeota bacterium]